MGAVGVPSPNRLLGLQKYLQKLGMSCQRESPTPVPGEIFAKFQKPIGYFASWRKGKAARLIMAYIPWSWGMILNMETAAFFPRTWRLAGGAHGGRGRGSGSRAASHESFLWAMWMQREVPGLKLSWQPAFWDEGTWAVSDCEENSLGGTEKGVEEVRECIAILRKLYCAESGCL